MTKENSRVPARELAALSLLVAAALFPATACSESDSAPSPDGGGSGGSPDGGGPGPLALGSDAARTARGVPVTIDVLANDEATSAELVRATEPAHGAVEIRDGRIVYTPAAGYSGDDEFGYVVARDGTEATARVTLTVLPQPGTVALGQLYTAEVSEDISWTGINARGDRVGEDQEGALVFVPVGGGRELITSPGPADYELVRGIGDDGTVLAQYLHADSFKWIGFAWKAGVTDRICELEEGDCTPESISADGTIVGTTYDYTVYTGFVWPPGGDRTPLSLDGYASTYAYDVAPVGTVVGVGDDSSDGYSGPSRCFAGRPGSLKVLPFTDGNPHFVSCRATNARGVIVGGVKPRADEAGVPRSVTDRMRAAIWHPDGGFAYVRFPFERPTAESWRIELLLGLNDDGVMVGYFQDATLVPTDENPERTTRVTRGITLTPVDALAGTSFEDSAFDHVNGPI